jgi:hypothetical protein
MKKHNIIIRMGAANWDAQVRKDNTYVRSDFHREFMNAYRASAAA